MSQDASRLGIVDFWKEWGAVKHVSVNFMLLDSSSFVVPQPRGVELPLALLRPSSQPRLSTSSINVQFVG